MRRLFMRMVPVSLLFIFLSFSVSAQESGLVIINSHHSAQQTLERLRHLIERDGYTVYSEFDHGGSKAVNKVIVFGNVRYHARIIWHDAAVGLELPFRIAVKQTGAQAAKVMYRKPTSLRDNYRVQNCALLDQLDEDFSALVGEAAR